MVLKAGRSYDSIALSPSDSATCSPHQEGLTGGLGFYMSRSNFRSCMTGFDLFVCSTGT